MKVYDGDDVPMFVLVWILISSPFFTTMGCWRTMMGFDQLVVGDVPSAREEKDELAVLAFCLSVWCRSESKSTAM